MKARNSPDRSDDWLTPRYIFDALDVLFDLDVAPAPSDVSHVPAVTYLDGDGLVEEWTGFVWMNPPFGHQSTKRRWLGRFFDHGNGIALVPDRTSAPWWQEFAPQASAISFLSPKVKFERRDGTIGEQPGEGTCLFAAGRRAARVLHVAGLGFTI